jgi:hypothetical protein
MARALFGPHGNAKSCSITSALPSLTLLIWGGCDYVLPAHHAQAR